MANWKEYTTKTTPEDADEIMIADYKANVSKRTPFSGLWNWIANKLATAVISQLETQNKSIIPALNELNSKGSYMLRISTGNRDSFKIKISSRCSILALFNDANGNSSIFLIEINAKNESSATKIFNERGAGIQISLEDGVLTISEKRWIMATLISTISISDIK